MPYVLKDKDGKIYAVSQAIPDSQTWQQIDIHSDDYVEFLDSAVTEQNPFRESDIQLARVLEDLISLLIERDLIRFTDFPDAAQKRLMSRQTLRKKRQLFDIVDESSDLIY